MKISIISTNDISGGAARAAYRLHLGLRAHSHDSKMFVQQKFGSNPYVFGPSTKIDIIKSKLYPFVEQLPLLFFNSENGHQHSPALMASINIKQILERNPDILQLHWINNGYVKPETLENISCPMVWRLADNWPFAGAEHIIYNDDRFIEGYSQKKETEAGLNINKWVWNRKRKAWKNLDNLYLVSPSRWLADRASKSYLFKDRPISVIPNGLDTNIYKPLAQQFSRRALNLPLHKKLIIFGALTPFSNKNKGFDLLHKALKKIQSRKDLIELVIFGTDPPTKEIDFGLPTHYLGRLHDDYTLALSYSAADIMIVPSRQESFGQTALEAQACGTPVVCFDTSGLRDVVVHQRTGYRAKTFSITDLARGIDWLIANEFLLKKISNQARRRVEKNFTLSHQAKAYISLYESILE